MDDYTMRESYNTKQKNSLIDYLSRCCPEGKTADELIQGMGDDAPSRSTVYRLLGQLCDEGTVHATLPEGERKCVYRLMAGSCREHLHLQCVDCGRLIHLDSTTSELLQNDVLTAAGFVLDEARTVLLGRCTSCAGRMGK